MAGVHNHSTWKTWILLFFCVFIHITQKIEQRRTKFPIIAGRKVKRYTLSLETEIKISLFLSRWNFPICHEECTCFIFLSISAGLFIYVAIQDCKQQLTKQFHFFCQLSYFYQLFFIHAASQIKTCLTTPWRKLTYYG